MPELEHIFREWLAIRRRVREERDFHLACSIDEFTALGLSRSQARHAARQRYGGNRSVALQALGGDLPSLLNELKRCPILASPAAWPTLLALAAAALMLVSPSSSLSLETLLGIAIAPADRASVFVSTTRNLIPRGISDADFERLRRLPGWSSVERYQAVHARARIDSALSPEAIESDLRLRLNRPDLCAFPLSQRSSVPAALVKAVWLLLFASGALLLLRAARRRSYPAPLEWLATSLSVLILHAVLSVAWWALLYQLWQCLPWTAGTAGVSLLLLAFSLWTASTALQFSIWSRDALRRCPQCLHRFRLPVQAGVTGCIILHEPCEESICIYGHGTIHESRWLDAFRPPERFLSGLLDG